MSILEKIRFNIIAALLLLLGAATAVSGESGPEYDELPLRYDDMGKYDKIAMEPYRDRYDMMPVAEKAEVYSRQFEYMRNRKPNFDPAVIGSGSLEAWEESKAATSAFDAKRHLYKPAVPKKRRPRPKPRPEPERQAAAEGRPGNLLEALPGPWESAAPPEPEPEPEFLEPEFEEEEFLPEPAGREYPDDHRRLENLRRGWDAVDVLRGQRRR